jgi:hypothetical protein
MADDALARLRAAKSKADGDEQARENFAAYVADRVENGGWSPADVAEYKAEVGQVMESGTDDDKEAAKVFWAHKAQRTSATGINARIRASIAAGERKAA